VQHDRTKFLRKTDIKDCRKALGVSSKLDSLNDYRSNIRIYNGGFMYIEKIKITRTNARLGLIKRIDKDYYELETSNGMMPINNTDKSLSREQLISYVFKAQGKRIEN